MVITRSRDKSLPVSGEWIPAGIQIHFVVEVVDVTSTAHIARSVVAIGPRRVSFAF